MSKNTGREGAKNEKKIQETKPQEKKSGSGIVLGFQIALAALLIAAAVALKAGFPTEYEEVRRRYYVLLNEELSFDNIGRYVTNLFQAGEVLDRPDPTNIISSGGLEAASSFGASSTESLPVGSLPPDEETADASSAGTAAE